MRNYSRYKNNNWDDIINRERNKVFRLLSIDIQIRSQQRSVQISRNMHNEGIDMELIAKLTDIQTYFR